MATLHVLSAKYLMIFKELAVTFDKGGITEEKRQSFLLTQHP